MSRDNEKLIEEARYEYKNPAPGSVGDLIRRLADALEAAEKAHTPTGHAKESDTSPERVKNAADSLHVTPTDDEREARLEYVIDAAVPVAEFPSWRFRYSRRIADAVLAAGFRRSEVSHD